MPPRAWGRRGVMDAQPNLVRHRVSRDCGNLDDERTAMTLALTPLISPSRGLLALAMALCACSGRPISAESADLAPSSAPTAFEPIAMPGTPPGIGFDELRFSADLGAVLVPAGRTGNIAIIETSSTRVTAIGGFSAAATHGGGQDFGVTSVDHGFDGLFATDRTSRRLHLLDPDTKKVVGSASLDSIPGHVRYFVPFREVWVTEPDKERIELFAMPEIGGPTAASAGGGAPVHQAFIPTQGGPVSLVLDVTRGRAYTHLRSGFTVAIDAADRKIVATWPNGCRTPRGIDLDEERGQIFVGCAEGKAVVVDASTGAQLGSLASGEGVDGIAFAKGLKHLYLPGATSQTMAILGVSAKGALSLLGTVPIPAGAHCVAADTSGNAYVCDPDRGRILKIKDPYPATP